MEKDLWYYKKSTITGVVGRFYKTKDQIKQVKVTVFDSGSVIVDSQHFHPKIRGARVASAKQIEVLTKALDMV